MSILRRVRAHIEAIIIRSINRHDYLHDKLDEIRNTIIIENEKNRNLMRFHNLEDSTLNFYYRGQQIRLYIPNADIDDIQGQILASNSFYEEEFLSLLNSLVSNRKGKVLDIGSNIGNHCVFFSVVCGFEECIAIEPNPQVFKVLQRNIVLNNLGNRVKALNCGAGKEKSVFYLGRTNPRNIGATGLTQEDCSSNEVKVIAIDDLNLDNIDLLKVDVEGMAVDVLTGARETIARCKPIIFIELFKYEFDAAQKILEPLGYNITHSLDWDYYIFQVNK